MRDSTRLVALFALLANLHSASALAGRVINMNEVCDSLSANQIKVIDKQAFIKRSNNTCSVINLDEALTKGSQLKD